MIKQNSISITPSLVIEYLYCPRFIYYMEVLKIPQNEETRFKVQKGRSIHQDKMVINKEYLRKKLGVVDKIIDEELASAKYHIHGKPDEVLFLEDGTAAPLDYKFAQFNDKIYETYKIQSVLYGMMITDTYDVSVTKGFIVYTRSNNHIEEISINDKDIKKAQQYINDILNIITLNYYPKPTKVKKRCPDCCYRNICIR